MSYTPLRSSKAHVAWCRRCPCVAALKSREDAAGSGAPVLAELVTCTQASKSARFSASHLFSLRNPDCDVSILGLLELKQLFSTGELCFQAGPMSGVAPLYVATPQLKKLQYLMDVFFLEAGKLISVCHRPPVLPFLS